MLQKFKITSYAFIVVFMTVQVFTIPAFGIEEPDGSSQPPKWDGKVPQPPKPHIDKSTMPKIEGEREKAVEPAKEGAVQNEWKDRYNIAQQRVIDCNDGVSAFISAMASIVDWLKIPQEAFAGRIDACLRLNNRNLTRESYEPQVHGRCVYWDTFHHAGGVVAAGNIMTDMFDDIHGFSAKIHSLRRDLLLSCEHNHPQDYYTHDGACQGERARRGRC